MQCPIDRVMKVLIETQKSFIYFKSNSSVKKCIDYSQEDLQRPSCLDYYPEKHLEDSQCFGLVSGDSKDCE